MSGFAMLFLLVFVKIMDYESLSGESVNRKNLFTHSPIHQIVLGVM